MGGNMNYTIAWLVIGAAGVLGTLGVFFLTRSVAHGGVRWVLRLLPLMLMIAPSPVPNYEGQVAPAFIVFTFESLFQSEGDSLPALIILVVAGVAAVLSGLLIGRFSRRKSIVEE